MKNNGDPSQGTAVSIRCDENMQANAPLGVGSFCHDAALDFFALGGICNSAREVAGCKATCGQVSQPLRKDFVQRAILNQLAKHPVYFFGKGLVGKYRSDAILLRLLAIRHEAPR